MYRSTFSLFILLLALLSGSVQAACLPLADSTELLTHCKVKISDYPKSVHLFIPVKHSAKYFVHFHGHNLDGYSHFDKRWGDYANYLLNSHSEAVLVLPESEGKCSTYDSYFADALKTKKFFLALEEELNGAELVGFSGHSGAYRVLNRLSGYANKNLLTVKALGMFDAIYSDSQEIKKLVKEKNIFFMDAFVTGPQATTEEISRQWMKELKGDNVFFIPIKAESGESLLDQHFLVLKRGSLEEFFSKASLL